MSGLVLASSSPRREELLKSLGLKFTIVPSKINEKVFNDLSPVDMVQELALAKAEEVAELVEDTVIIAADTLVVCDGDILGKPSSKEEAFTMLKKLSAKKHKVLTGLVLLSSNNGKFLLNYDETEVYMRPLMDNEISSYINTGEPMDKAGSYSIQGLGGVFIEKIIGSYFTVMGLPIHKLLLMMREFSLDIF
jgi:septum formation protein